MNGRQYLVKLNIPHTMIFSGSSYAPEVRSSIKNDIVGL